MVYSTGAGLVVGIAAAVLFAGRGTMVSVIGATPLSVIAVAVELSPIVNDREALPLAVLVKVARGATVLLLP